MKLWPLQTQAIEVMQGKPGFILGDAVGLGKTVTSLAEIPQQNLNVLVVCLNSMKQYWLSKIKEMHPQAKATLDLESFTAGFLVINYEALYVRGEKAVKPKPKLLRIKWHWIIADDAYAIQNRRAKQTKALKKIKGLHKRALQDLNTMGMPDQIWSLLNWIGPKEWSSYWRFFSEFIDSEIIYPYGFRKILGPKRQALLRHRMKDVYICRTKAEARPDLPQVLPPTILPVVLSAEQQIAYDQMRVDSIAWLAKQEVLEAPTVLAQLTRLRQFACAFARLENGKVQLAFPSSKLEALIDFIRSTEQKIVVFSQFEQVIQLCHRRFDRLRIQHSVMVGATPPQARQSLVDGFATNKDRAFLATMQTGGVGIDGLQRASSICVFFDRHWSPMRNDQALGRLDRHGQKESVQPVYLQAQGTVDLVVEARLEMKREWIRSILGA